MEASVARLKEDSFDFVHDSPGVFRTLMMAAALPGEIGRIRHVPLRLTRESHGPVTQALLALLDLETSFSVHCESAEMRSEAEKYLEITPGAAPAECGSADFVLCLGPSLDGRFPLLKRGSLSEPHKSATVFYLVDRLEARPGNGMRQIELTGPGIRERKSFFVAGLDGGEIESWKGHRSRFPVGIDIYLVGRGGEIVGIPRSVTVAA